MGNIRSNLQEKYVRLYHEYLESSARLARVAKKLTDDELQQCKVRVCEERIERRRKKARVERSAAQILANPPEFPELD